MRLRGRNAIVYGAGSPVGRAVADAYAREGAALVLVGRSVDQLEQIAALARAGGTPADVVAFDPLDEQAVDELVRRVVEHGGGLDVSIVVIEQADVHGIPLIDMTTADFTRPLLTGVLTMFVTARAAARHMVRQGSGLILTVAVSSSSTSSAAAFRGGTEVAEAAIATLQRTLAAEVRPHGVRVVGIRAHPGRPATDTAATAVRLAAPDSLPQRKDRNVTTVPYAPTLGLTLPTSGDRANAETIVKVAQTAERIGLAAVWTFERILRPVGPAEPIGGGPAMPLPEDYSRVFDPLDVLAYVAAQTHTIRLGTSILDAILHTPVVLARRLATVDQLSGGRLIAGLGQGWMLDEFTTTGVPTAARGARFEEHLTAMRAAWGPDPVRFHGSFYTIPESRIGPKPVGANGPTTIAGAMSDPAVARAARLGVGLNTIMISWDFLEHTVATFRRAAEKAGHDPSLLPVVVRVNGTVSANPDEEPGPLTGGVDHVLTELARARALDVSHVFWAMDSGPEEQVAVMERLQGAYSSGSE